MHMRGLLQLRCNRSCHFFLLYIHICVHITAHAFMNAVSFHILFSFFLHAFLQALSSHNLFIVSVAFAAILCACYCCCLCCIINEFARTWSWRVGNSRFDGNNRTPRNRRLAMNGGIEIRAVYSVHT